MLIQFLPEYSSWEDWNGNLLHYFGDQQFPFLSEIQWKDVASSVMLNPVFAAFNVPSPEPYTDWRDWARTFTTNVNGVAR